MAEGSRYQDKTEKRGRWKARLKYAAGTAALVFTVLLALFLPGWYSGWRETGAMEQVVLEKREEIRLLDMEALDISTKLAMLGESEEFNYSVTVDITGAGETNLQYQELVDEKLSEWQDCHLLPENPFPTGIIEGGEDWNIGLDTYVKIDAGLIPVRTLIRERSVDSGSIEVVILDQSNDFLYYVGIVSEPVLFYILQNLGVGTDEELMQKMADGTYSMDMIRDLSWYDYASVCGADSQEIRAADRTGIFQDVTLRYEEFDVSAFRSMINFEGEFGLQTMFGTDRWAELAYTIVNLYTGRGVYKVDHSEWVDTWNEEAIGYGRDDLLLIPETETEIAAAQQEAGSSPDGYEENVPDVILSDEAEEQAEWYDGKEEISWQEEELMRRYGIDPADLPEEKKEQILRDIQDKEQMGNYGIEPAAEAADDGW